MHHFFFGKHAPDQNTSQCEDGDDADQRTEGERNAREEEEDTQITWMADHLIRSALDELVVFLQSDFDTELFGKILFACLHKYKARDGNG